MAYPREIEFSGKYKIIVSMIPNNLEKYICNICSCFAIQICWNCRYPVSPGCTHYEIEDKSFCEKCKNLTTLLPLNLSNDIKQKIITRCKFSTNGCRKEISLSERANHIKFCIHNKKGTFKLLLIAKFFKKKKPFNYSVKGKKVFAEFENFNFFKNRIIYLVHPYLVKLFQFELISRNSTSYKILYIIMKYIPNINSIHFESIQYSPKSHKIFMSSLNFLKNLEILTFQNCNFNTVLFRTFTQSFKLLEKVRELKFHNCSLPKRGNKYYNELFQKLKRISKIEFSYLVCNNDPNGIHLNKFFLSFRN